MFQGSLDLRLLRRLLFLLAIYSILRIGFYFYHFSIYRQFQFFDITESLLLGIRFDLAGIILLNIPTILLNLFTLQHRLYERTERFIFILLNTLGVLMALDDFELFLFMGKRLSYDLFFITDDIIEQLPQLLLNYWYLPFGTFLFGVGFYFIDKKFSSPLNPLSLKRSLLRLPLILGLSFLAIRGGLQSKSINIQSAFIQGKNELGHLVLNTPYHFFRTLGKKTPKKMSFFNSDTEAKSLIKQQRDFSLPFKGRKNANVVLIILESFSSEYLEKGYAPFFNSLKSQGVYFEHHLANGRRSIEALPSLLCGLPSLLDTPISKSLFSGNKFNSFPQILKQHNYTNAFFHGGNRGTMGFESYTLSHGFDRYFARDDYGEKDYDGTWGVYDFPYLEYVLREISKLKEPFLTGVFTLSSHQPYSIPPEHKGKFPKGTLDIHESIGYVDFSLRNFFQKAQTQPWFQNTYFILTADHTQKLETTKYSHLVGRYRVPLLILGPNLSPKVSLKVTQHSDIPRTVLDLVELEGRLPATSVSVFSNDPGFALNFSDGNNYFAVTGERVFNLSSEWEYDWASGEMTEKKNSEDPLLKAYLQYFINGLINNNLDL